MPACTCAIACDSARPGRTSKEKVTEVSWPRCATCSGPTPYLSFATALSGTSAPVDERRPMIELIDVGAAHHVLIGALRELAADADRRHVLQEHLGAHHLRELRAQLAHHLVGGLALLEGLERDRHAPAIERRRESG